MMPGRPAPTICASCLYGHKRGRSDELPTARLLFAKHERVAGHGEGEGRPGNRADVALARYHGRDRELRRIDGIRPRVRVDAHGRVTVGRNAIPSLRSVKTARIHGHGVTQRLELV